MDEKNTENLAEIISDTQFEEIELILKDPNIFKALSIERKEIRHSNFISYILNPQENHGLKDIVLRKFLKDIFSDNKADSRTIFDADTLDLQSVEIRREWRNIDILIILDDDVIIVENKVDTVDHSNQLQGYKKIAEETFPDKRKHYVYMTPIGSDPVDSDSKNDYINYSYIQISEIIKTLLDLYKNSISTKIHYYLEDYLVMIKREILMNDSLNELAVKVYNAHKDAFDFVFRNMPDPSTILYPYFEKALKEAGYVIGSKNKGYIRFTTNELASKLPRTGQGWPDNEVFLFEIEYFWSDKYAVVNAVISPCDDDIKDKIIKSVEGSQKFKIPSGKKWLVFYKKKFPFIASEIINEDPSEIEKRISTIIENIKPAVDEFCKLILKHM